MKDEDLEHLLQRYEPAAPPSSLRARIVLSARIEPRRVWPWAAAAAALLALTLWLHGATNRVLQVPEIRQPSTSSAEETLLTDMLGGTDDARAIARTIVALDNVAQRNADPIGTSGMNGDPR